jgi:hypothetical protein
MSTQQTNRRGVASAKCTEWPHMVSARLLLAVTLPSTGFLLLARTPLLLSSMSLIALAISAIVARCLSSDFSNTNHVLKRQLNSFARCCR